MSTTGNITIKFEVDGCAVACVVRGEVDQALGVAKFFQRLVKEASVNGVNTVWSLLMGDEGELPTVHSIYWTEEEAREAGDNIKIFGRTLIIRKHHIEG